jgi:predicted molibdopterin-dependent oxidoreductase YjgC
MDVMENKITINGHKYAFKPGETILQVARRNNVYIPTLCFLKGSTPTGACRICIVEAKGVPGFISSCSTPAGPKLEVFTETQKVRNARRTILELMLISGNHNCSVRDVLPHEWSDFQKMVGEYDQAEDICAAYGKCQLQALAYRYLVTERTMDSLEVKYPLDAEDPLIGRDYSRCILCGRCVYACNEVQVNRAISHGHRGIQAKIAFRGDGTIPESDCVYCGECIQVCPVGSLFEKKNRFDARMWDVKQVRTTCHYCGVGCQLELHVNEKEGKIVKVRGIDEAEPNHDGRLCFRGRFAFDFIHSPKRLTKPMIRKNGKLLEASWDEALDLIAVKMKEIEGKHGPDRMGCAVSTKYTNEDLFQARKFFQTVLSADNIVHFEASSHPGIVYEELEKASTLVVAGTDITRENPVAGSYVKQAVLNGVKLIVVDSGNTEIARFAKVHLKDLEDPSAIEKVIDGDNIIVIRHSEYDITPLKKMSNVKIYSLTRENNTIGAYFTGIKPGDGFDLSNMRFIYSMGGHFKKRDGVEFLVIQDFFPNEYTEAADVVLPAAVWVEYEGTYISSDNRVNRVRKAVDPPGEAKPTWRIFKELAERMGHSWESASSKDIWENEIGREAPHLKEINYRVLDEGDGIKVDKGYSLSFKGANVPPEGVERPDDHKILCSHCEDMENVFKKLF